MSQKPQRSKVRTLTSPAFDVWAARMACWLVSGLVLVLGLLTLARLPLTEGQVFLGLLLICNLSLTGVLIGLVLPLVVRTDEESL